MRPILTSLILSLLACGGSTTPAETPASEPVAATTPATAPAAQTMMDGQSCVEAEIQARSEELCFQEFREGDYEDPAEFAEAFPDAENGVTRACVGIACMSCIDEYLSRADCECGNMETCANLAGAEWLQTYLGLAANDDVDARVTEQLAEIERRAQ